MPPPKSKATVSPSEASLPRYAAELATLVKTPPDGDSWVHEIKFDGYRFGSRLDAGKVNLISRNGNDWTARLPAVTAALKELPVKRALLDGEVAVVLPDGRTSFPALQEALSGSSAPLVYFLFDILHLNGRDTRGLPVEDRKGLVRACLGGVGPESLVRYSDHVVGQGPGFFEQARRLGLEGIVSKKRGSLYRSGRTLDWVKTKCVRRQEFVICGFVNREKTTDRVGSLILGVYDTNGGLVYCGQVGTGFTEDSATRLHAKLSSLVTKHCPFPGAPPDLTEHRWGRRRDTPPVPKWTRPDLVCEVTFTEWTPDHTLRHPSYQGVREDKDPSDVVRE
jgi:bifunctional non-homologous end joining protein LigD